MGPTITQDAAISILGLKFIAWILGNSKLQLTRTSFVSMLSRFILKAVHATQQIKMKNSQKASVFFFMVESALSAAEKSLCSLGSLSTN